MANSSKQPPRIEILKASLSSSKPAKVYNRLPDAARTMLEILKSNDAFLRIVGRYGGCTINVPTKWPPVGQKTSYRGHPLRRVLTPNQMLKIVAHYGGTALYVPNCDKFWLNLRNKAIIKTFIKDTRKGKSSGYIVQKLARRHKISDRRVWEILKTNAE